MDPFQQLYSSLVAPITGTPAHYVSTTPTTSTATPASSSGFSFSGLLGNISDVANRGISAYRNFTAPTQAQTAAAKAQSYMPLILLGGGVLVVIVILILLFRRK